MLSTLLSTIIAVLVVRENKDLFYKLVKVIKLVINSDYKHKKKSKSWNLQRERKQAYNIVGNHGSKGSNSCLMIDTNGFQEESRQGIYSIISSKITAEFEKSRSLHKSVPHPET